ncbi:WxL protein peptidoglycan domain-containing protein [Listeria aquatica]|uniref:DUF916 domain-containing protein n=1 Tax=Listeria aquatica TaxID=1494960 RepID=UPI003EF93560
MKKIFYIVVCLIAFCLIYPAQTLAKNTSSDMAYYVEAIIPDNQMDQTKTYFDLLAKPGEWQTLQLRVHNARSEELTLEIKPHTARTGTGGDIDYSGDDKSSLATSLPYSIEELLEGEEQVTLKPNETRTVSFTLKVPKKAFSGVLLGGFYIHEKNQAKQVDDKKEGVSIKNQYAYVIGCKVRVDEEEEEQQFALKTPKLTKWNDLPAISVGLTNEASRILSQYELQGEIRNHSGKKIQEIKKRTFSMAPDSVYQLIEKVSLDDFSSGKYSYALTVKGENEVWHLKKNFTISGDQIKQVQTDEEKHESNFLNVLIIGIAVLLLLAILIFVLLKRRRKNEEGS